MSSPTEAGNPTVFDMFTDAAKRVVVHAQEEGTRLHHRRMGPEHLLLGLLREEEDLAARALGGLGVGYEAAEAEVLRAIPARKRPVDDGLPFSRETRAALRYSFHASARHGHGHLGTEHLLLGVLYRDRATVPGLLRNLGIAPERVRGEVEDLIAAMTREAAEPGPPVTNPATEAPSPDSAPESP